MRAELESKMERTEIRVIRWMCGVSLKERHTSIELRRCLGVEAIWDVMRRFTPRGHGSCRQGEEDLAEHSVCQHAYAESLPSERIRQCRM